MRRVLIIAGPTAAGKSALAMDVAARAGAAIVSADAMQVYRDMNIGTASPSAKDLSAVKHFGVNVRDPHEAFSAADFLEIADPLIENGRKIIIVGGTSMYLQALIRGLVKTPPVDPVLREELEGAENLHERLMKLDPELAARLHPNDRLRIVRGLEVVLLGGTPLSQLHKEHAAQPDRFEYNGLWVEREDLYSRINQRVDLMMDGGYLEEVDQLLNRGVVRSLKPMMSLGYRHLTAHLLDGLPLEEAVRLTKRDTRHFSRKQRNWMRHLGFPQIGFDQLERAADTAVQNFRD